MVGLGALLGLYLRTVLLSIVKLTSPPITFNFSERLEIAFELLSVVPEREVF